ncbi:MAG: hypothetical protein Q9205_004480 [Flavoplaca limonia]
MARLNRSILRFPVISFPQIRKQPVSTATTPSTASKPTGDISSVFPSLSGSASKPLPPRFVDIKKRLIRGHEAQIQASWKRLLRVLQQKRDEIKTKGSDMVPEINFWDLNDVEKRTKFRDALHQTGVAVIRGVVQEKEALGWKELVKRYISSNPTTKGFPSTNPAVYELYWSPSQILARSHPNILRVQKFLMSHWHSAGGPSDTKHLISTSHPLSYADRLRLRQPGDTSFALGPHIDGGSCERWEPSGYGLGGVYNEIFNGNWEKYTPWEMSRRIPVRSDLYNGPGGCSMYRMFQGWVAMSEIRGGHGHLKICPMIKEATAYVLLRPFFSPSKSQDNPRYLDIAYWPLENPVSSSLQGAVPANCQELNTELHPHLGLDDTMIHVPEVRPGDYVAWHCDVIHAVDSIHMGPTDSSVLYIPACPLTEANADYLARQRETFAEGTPAPDFPSGEGEAQHRGRLTAEYVMKNISTKAQRAMGLAAFDTKHRHLFDRERETLEMANRILDFGDA